MHGYSKTGKYIAWILLGGWALLNFFILGLALLNSLKTSAEIYADILSFPEQLYWQNYRNALVNAQMYRYFFNSIFIVGGTLVILTAICSMAAYVLARYHFRGKRILMLSVIFGMGIPDLLLIIPLYNMVSRMGMTDTKIALVLVYVALCIPFTIYVMIGYFTSLPNEVREAAIVDGCSEQGTFWRIMFPLAKPGLFAVASFNFVWMWNEYLLAMVFTSSKENRTMALGMYALQNSMTFTIDYGALFAGIMLMIIPAAIIYTLFHKYIVAGVTVGAVKG
ncbi:carbohydrate ABC transporter permease [uncultured Ruthenibacterium sp.]|uniref:carbohydrate ABC transporter permease n=1 Tax=uncultured Ruthenibacterium sp. TaxID=1905347 RepID=UPI00349E5FCA